MRYAEFDYYPEEQDASSQQIRQWWSDHWQGSSAFRFDPREDPIWATIEDVLKPPGRLLEAGCGRGEWVYLFDSLGYSAVGIDHAYAGLQIGKSCAASLRILSGDLNALPFPEESFDYIYSGGAIEHIVEGPTGALQEFHRVLKTGGTLVCAVPCLSIKRQLALPWVAIRDSLKQVKLIRKLAGKTETFEFYQYLFTPATYKALLSQCGFNVLALRPFGEESKDSIGHALRRVTGAKLEFYNPHMMTAVCHKIPTTFSSPSAYNGHSNK